MWASAFVLLAFACGPGDSGGLVTAAESESSATGSGATSASSSSSNESSESETQATTVPGTSFVPDDDGSCCGGEEGTSEWGVRCSFGCDPVVQDCPEGEKCVPYASTGESLNDHRCVQVLGDLGVGQACTLDDFVAGTDDCDISSYCVASEDGPGYCRPFCTPGQDGPACPAGMACTAGPTDDFVICLPTCELPELSAACDPGEACYLWPDDPLVCLPEGDAMPGQACTGANGCVAETYCVDGTLVIGCVDESCCAPFCDLNDGGLACAVLPGSECVALFEPGFGPENHGLCLDPAGLP